MTFTRHDGLDNLLMNYRPPSLPGADPRAGLPRRGGRKSNFLAENADAHQT